MGRYKAGSIITRDLGWGKLTFGDEYHITLELPHEMVVFHRYGTTRKFYSSNWKHFRQECARRKLESVYDVFKFADRFEIEHYTKLINQKERRADGKTAD